VIRSCLIKGKEKINPLEEPYRWRLVAYFEADHFESSPSVAGFLVFIG